MSELATVVVSSLVGGAVAFVGAATKNALDTRSKIDESLRTVRQAAYEKLWLLTALLPKYPRATLRYGQLDQLRRDLRDWYFTTGGMWMSRPTSKRYFALQDVLATLPYDDPDRPVDEPEYDKVREACSKLRSATTDDLLSRRGHSSLAG